MLQEIPVTSDSEARTTCRCVDCDLAGTVMLPGSYRISVEKRASTDPSYYYLPYKPAAKLSEIQQTPPGPDGLHGLGKNGQEWFCVECFEAMLSLHRQRMQRDRPGMTFLPGHPVWEVVYYILAEERKIVGREGRLLLSSTKRHGLEL